MDEYDFRLSHTIEIIKIINEFISTLNNIDYNFSFNSEYSFLSNLLTECNDINKNKIFIIEGLIGIGKSTLIKSIKKDMRLSKYSKFINIKTNN